LRFDEEKPLKLGILLQAGARTLTGKFDRPMA
jgi:hypothetical protein